VCDLQKSLLFILVSHSSFPSLARLPASTRSKSLRKTNGKDSKELLSYEREAHDNSTSTTFSSASRLNGELLQVLVIGDVGGDGVADDIRGLFAIRLLPLGVELLVGLGDFLLRCY
jgi:hypothetical protein